MSTYFQTSTYEKLNSEIKGLASLYFKALELSKNENGEKKQFHLVNLVRNAYASLNREERTFINNEFFYQKYPYWWKDYYSFSSYRRTKYKSMTHFLEVFYDSAI